MENWLEHICEPKSLFLAWQAPDHFGDRFRYAVGKVSPSSDGWILRYFEAGSEFEGFNDGRTYEALWQLGYAGYAAFSVKVREHKTGVMEAFNRRLPPANRSDFAEYIRHFRLPDSAQLSSFTLLAKTEATLPSDGFSLVDPLDGNAGQCDLMTEVAGYRYYAKQADGLVRLGVPVDVEPEPENKHDARAVAFKIGGVTIGYVNRLQTAAYHRWIAERSITASIERINGKAGRPRLFVFVRVRSASNEELLRKIA